MSDELLSDKDYLFKNLTNDITKDLFWSTLTGINPVFRPIKDACNIYDMAESIYKIKHLGEVFCKSKSEALERKRNLEIINLGFTMTGYGLSGIFTQIPWIQAHPFIGGAFFLIFTLVWTIAKNVTKTVYRAKSKKKKTKKTKKNNCFRDLDKVTVLREGKECNIYVHEVSIGDLVKTLFDGYQKVYYINIPNCNDTVTVKVFTFKSKTEELHNVKKINGQIGLTSSHLIYDKSGNLKRAEDLSVGDYIQTLNGDATITHIEYKQASVRNIFTIKGELMLNGVRISSYAGTPKLAKFIHNLSAPLRQFANLTAKSEKVSNYICKFIVAQGFINDSNINSIHSNNAAAIKLAFCKEILKNAIL